MRLIKMSVGMNLFVKKLPEHRDVARGAQGVRYFPGLQIIMGLPNYSGGVEKS